MFIIFFLPVLRGFGFDVLPLATNTTSLCVMAQGTASGPAQRVLISTMQGLAARSSGKQIYFRNNDNYQAWFEHIRDHYAIPVTTFNNFWTLFSQFTSIPSGYILCDTNLPDTLNAATSLSGPFNAIAVDKTLESTVRGYSITNLILDVSTRNEAWVWSNYSNLFSRKVTVEQRESFTLQLRDYATMANAFFFYDGISSFRSTVINSLNANAACIGWGDASGGEDDFVKPSSSSGVYTVGADWALNLATFSGVRDDNLAQKTYHTRGPEENVHYVTFVLTDGDNVQFNLGDLWKRYSDSPRGKFAMGWSISPSLAELAPSVARYYYKHASNALGSDFFVSGPSGSGYMYPSYYPTADLNIHVEKLNWQMSELDLNICQILDFNSFNRTDLWNKYLSQPSIEALLYLEYSRYNNLGGAAYLNTDGKPVISARDMLWEGLQEETTLINNLNSYPSDVYSPSAYTFVTVHVWSKNLTNIQAVVTNLNPSVRVVTPREFVRFFRDNVGRKTFFDFAFSSQGWTGATSGKSLDKAEYLAYGGNPGGRLRLDGSDFLISDSNPNAWFGRQLTIPHNAEVLKFDSYANGEGLLRIRLKLANGSFITLMNWAAESPLNQWVPKSIPIVAYSGQTVTLYFEQDDAGLGVGEQRMLDNITFGASSGPVAYKPDTPRLLSISGIAVPTITWRPDGESHSGFVIERALSGSGAWSVAGTAGTAATTFTDYEAPGGATWQYRIRAQNSGGQSLPSNTKQMAVPARPALAINHEGNQVWVTWPASATGYALRTSTSLGGTEWTTVPGPVLPIGTNLGVMITPSSHRQFFRLQQP